MGFVPAWPPKTAARRCLGAERAVAVAFLPKRPEQGSGEAHAHFPTQRKTLSAQPLSTGVWRSAYKVSNHAFLLLAVSTTERSSRVGIIVAKKHIRRATRRNRIKRLVREQFRLKPFLTSLDLVVLARSAADRLDNQAFGENSIRCGSSSSKRLRHDAMH